MTDPFSELLTFMQARSVMSGGLVAGGRWAIAFPPATQLKFWGVLRGTCWLKIKGESTPIAVNEGDVFLLSAERPHIMASDLSATPVDLQQILDKRVGALAYHGDGDEFFMIGGKVELSPDSEHLLRAALAPFIHLNARTHALETLHWLLNQLVREREHDRPGAAVASSQLAHLMFIEILRLHFETAPPLSGSWLRAMTDKRLAPALRLIHGEPGETRPLEVLAKACAMSRASFAAYFKDVAGVSPMAYLTQWRMRLAARALAEGKRSLIELALSLGYNSQSAFSHAFKREIGRSPLHYQQALRVSTEAQYPQTNAWGSELS